MPLIPTPRRQKQANRCEFEDSLVYTDSPKPANSYIVKLSQKKQKLKKKYNNLELSQVRYFPRLTPKKIPCPAICRESRHFDALLCVASVWETFCCTG